MRIANAANVIYNAPIVSFGVDADQIEFPDGNVDYSKVHDEVVAIDLSNMTVTIQRINGFSFGRPVWYIIDGCKYPVGGGYRTQYLRPTDAETPFGGR